MTSGEHSHWQKFTRARISRRRALQQGAMVSAGAGAFWLVGCDDDADRGGGGDDPGTETTTATAAVHGGRYRVATPVDFDTFEPYLSIAGATQYFPRIYNVLVNFAATDGTRFDDLSTAYEQPDDVTYIFAIRQGVRIGPNTLGVPERDLNAADVVASYDHIKSAPETNAYAFIGKWLASHSASADGRTYTFNATGPYAYFRDRIGSYLNTILPAEALAEPNVSKLAQQAAGAGAFSLVRYAEGEGATFDRNPNYYRVDDASDGSRLPYIDGMDVKVITDRASMRVAFQSDQLDVYTAQDKAEVDALTDGNAYTVVRDPVYTFIAFLMNPTRKPWDDDRIRMAALYALNRQEYVDLVYRGEARPNGLVHWPLENAALAPEELETLQPFDPARSRELIRAATGADTIKVNLLMGAEIALQEYNLHVPIFLEQMRAAGFDISVDQQPFAVALDRLTNVQYDAGLSPTQILEYPEFNLDFQHSEGPSRNGLYAVGVGQLYPEIDREIDRVKGLTDADELYPAIHELQRSIYAKGPTFVPLVSPYSFTMYQPRVKNIPQGLGASALWVNTWWLDSA